ncbi:MAG TPA: decaprenylphospho-beta-D-erythro-pentofuranosid-2-ulose 2-reductase [Actinomycetota bacterium]|nr:decaprenylphospho-beta-D-erythro-pentofuranosid-2-ulose 2-reductase [Actinomycetota bacterium]
MNDAFGAPQSVLVLGGSSDIARAILRRLVSQRTRTVILAGRDEQRLAAAVEESRGLGAVTVDTVAFDAIDTERHQTVVADVFARHGDIDLVLIAFGLLGDPDLDGGDLEAALAVARVNYLGALSAGLVAARCLRRQGHGLIVALSSVAGERVRADNYVYGSSKAGMDGFFQGLGDALAGTGVRVLIVRPGFVRTKMTAGRPPAPFATTADAVANEVIRGIESGASVVYSPPILRGLMAVLRLLPRPLFRRLNDVRGKRR